MEDTRCPVQAAHIIRKEYLMHKILARATLTVVALLLLLSLPTAADVLAQQPPVASPRHVASLPIETTPRQYQLVMQVVDFAPDNTIASQIHGGDAFLTVVQGSVFRTDEGGPESFGAGASFSVPAGTNYSVRNVGSADARLVRSILLPLGAPKDAGGDGGTGTATMTYEAETTLGRQPAEFNLFHLLIDIPSGGIAPHHDHAGPGLVMTLEGVLIQQIGSRQETTRPGDVVLDTGDHRARVEGNEPVLIWATFLIPPGIQPVIPKPPSSTQAPAAPIRAPSAGDGGLLSGARESGQDAVLTLVLVGGLVLATYPVMRRIDHRN